MTSPLPGNKKAGDEWRQPRPDQHPARSGASSALARQLTAFFTSAAILSSTAAVSSFSA